MFRKRRENLNGHHRGKSRPISTQFVSSHHPWPSDEALGLPQLCCWNEKILYLLSGRYGLRRYQWIPFCPCKSPKRGERHTSSSPMFEDCACMRRDEVPRHKQCGSATRMLQHSPREAARVCTSYHANVCLPIGSHKKLYELSKTLNGLTHDRETRSSSWCDIPQLMTPTWGPWDMAVVDELD